MGDRIHFVFSPSGGGSLREAIKASGSGDRVLTLFDDLSFGPITSIEPQQRAAWISENLGIDWDESWWRKDEYFWSTARAMSDIPAVVWVNRNSATEFAGFLAFVSSKVDRAYSVVDVSDLAIPHFNEGARAKVPSLATILPEQFIKEQLLSKSTLLATNDERALVEMWQNLQQEAAPLRVVTTNGYLISAPEDFFDDELLYYAGREWRKVAWVLTDTWASIWSKCRRVSELFIASRLNALVDNGQLEIKGNPDSIHESWVRHGMR